MSDRPNDRRGGRGQAVRAWGPARREHLFDTRRRVRRHLDGAPAEHARSHASTQAGGRPRIGIATSTGEASSAGALSAHAAAATATGAEPTSRGVGSFNSLMASVISDVVTGAGKARQARAGVILATRSTQRQRGLGAQRRLAVPIGHHDDIAAGRLVDVVGAVNRGVVRLDRARLADVERLARGDVAASSIEHDA